MVKIDINTDNCSNKAIGNNFEKAFCQYLSDCGFWVYNLNCKTAGQPFDVIAVKNNVSYVFDCKVCSNDYLVLSRIEANQLSSMGLYMNCGNHMAFFACLDSQNHVCLISISSIMNALSNGTKRINVKEDGIYESDCIK